MECGILIPIHAPYRYSSNFWVLKMSDFTELNFHISFLSFVSLVFFFPISSSLNDGKCFLVKHPSLPALQ